MDEDAPSGLRTLLVGIDGVGLSLLDSLFEEGHLPTLRSVFEDGVDGDLTSQLPPWTPSAWPSLYTGVNPGKHGTFDFLTFDGYDWGLADRSTVREHAVWELLDRAGYRSVVVNVPVTAPPLPFDGALLPGYIAPEDPPCHPDGVLDDVRAEIGAYRVYKPDGLDDDGRREWYGRLVSMRGEAFRYLTDRFDPDFGFLQFQQTDTVFHEMPDDREAVVDVFEAVDDEVGAVVDACDPETVVVVSDHGIGPYEGPEFRVNEHLRDIGLLRTTRGDGGMPSWSSINRGRDGESDSAPSLAERAVAAASSVGLTSQRIGRLLGALGLREFVLDHVSSDVVRAGTERVDFPSSTAYMRSRTEMGVRINLAGRDPDGDVSPAEYPSVREDLVDELSSLTTPDGRSVFETVLPAEAVYSGPYVDEAVDIVTVPAEFDVYLSASLRGAPFGDLPEPWNHKREGLVAAAGHGVDAAVELDDAHLFDVAPTVLSLFGVAPSDRMDGEVLQFADPVAPTEYPPFDPPDGSDDVDDAVRRRLADMGYLEDGFDA
jgi:predicted AlkP superfamily phosphohydrolase/phosphomutase